MQQGSAEAIKAVLTAMGGRDRKPELVELKRQTMMLKYFGDQLKREQHYKGLHAEGGDEARVWNGFKVRW